MAKAKQQRNYQELKQALDEILASLQHESTDIDEAIKLHKEGVAVLAELEKYLESASKSTKEK